MIARTIIGAVAAFMVFACTSTTTSQLGAADERCSISNPNPVELAGGSFVIGENAVYPEEGPPRQVSVGGFWIDRLEVTNLQFAEFVDATGYITVAERPVDPTSFGVSVDRIPGELLKPGAAVFRAPDTLTRSHSEWWTYVPGAYWLYPLGPDGTTARSNDPVVHLVWEDMMAFAEWKGGRLPSEAEWEFAAHSRGETLAEQPRNANTWQGVFPIANTQSDGFAGIAAVGCFEPNDNGLYDMIGNVWEVTQTAYNEGQARPKNSEIGGQPVGGADSALSRTLKGGSYLCAVNYCQRYRPAARQAHDPSLGMGHVGFRLVYDRKPDFFKLPN